MYELHKACAAGNVPLIKKLLDQGHSITAVDNKENAPIFYAIHGNHFDATSCLIKHNVQTLSLNDREASLSEAHQLESAARIFVKLGKKDTAAKAFNAAINILESIHDKSDIDIRLYIQCVEGFALHSKEHSNNLLLEAAIKIINACGSVKNKTEFEHLNTYFYSRNMGELYRVSNQNDKAAEAYLNAIQQIPKIKRQVEPILSSGSGMFEGLSQCYHQQSLENKFYLLAADCLTEQTRPVITTQLEDILLKIISENDLTLANSASILIQTLLFFYRVDVLNNMHLRIYLGDNDNKELLVWYHETLKLMTDKNDNHYKTSIPFFATTKDTMDNNEPPENLEKTCEWSCRL